MEQFSIFSVENEEGVLIVIGLINCIESESGELGFQLNNRYWGRGYGTQVAEVLVVVAKEHAKLAELTAKVNIENTPSIHILDALGMERVSESGSQWVL